MSEKMNAHFAVFNGHANRADERARALLAMFDPAALAEVERIERDGGGIMAIFDRPPTRATKLYAETVQGFVNARR